MGVPNSTGVFQKGSYKCLVRQFFGLDGTDLQVLVRESHGLASFWLTERVT